MPAARRCCGPSPNACADYLLTTSVQTGASYDTSQRATRAARRGAAAMATLVNASRPEEVVFGHSTTVLVRFLATAMASQLQPGDEIVVTDFDHESNIGPWLHAEGARRRLQDLGDRPRHAAARLDATRHG